MAKKLEVQRDIGTTWRLFVVEGKGKATFEDKSDAHKLAAADLLIEKSEQLCRLARAKGGLGYDVHGLCEELEAALAASRVPEENQ